jgi:hypothetical protein
MDQLPTARWRVVAADILLAGLPVAFVACSAVLAGDASRWAAAALILSLVAGFFAATALQTLDHIRLPPWVGVAGLAVGLVITQLLPLSDQTLAVALACIAGFLFAVFVRHRRRRRRASTVG